jgi:protein-tyrosine phosphatase
MKHTILTVLVLGLLATVGPTSHAEPEGADPRHIPLDGQPNFRDLGGYRTADGKTVRRGMVFRSGELARLSDDDVARLEQLGIRTVVSFLTDKETEAVGRDRLPDGVREVAQPIESDGGLAAKVLKARQTADFSEVPVELNIDLHRVLVREAREQYAALLREILAQPERSLTFHCSHGVHRTGVASAVLLWGLGVPWEAVRQDYLLSNDCRSEEIEKRFGQLRAQAAKLRGIPPEQVDMTNIEAFYRLEGSYIDAARDEIIKRYGSIDGYLRKGLGLTADEIRRLRDQLLE